MDLENKKSSFILISSDKIEEISSILYAKNYNIIDLQEYYRGSYKPCILAYNNEGNDSLRDDALFILNHFKENSMTIKYLEDEVVKEIKFDGSENLLEVSMFNTDEDKISYVLNGISFSFINSNRYWKPNSKKDLKDGMTVEYMNNNIWHEKEIINLNEEYEDFFKLLIKYNRLRVKSI